MSFPVACAQVGLFNGGPMADRLPGDKRDAQLARDVVRADWGLRQRQRLDKRRLGLTIGTSDQPLAETNKRRAANKQSVDRPEDDATSGGDDCADATERKGATARTVVAVA